MPPYPTRPHPERILRAKYLRYVLVELIHHWTCYGEGRPTALDLAIELASEGFEFAGRPTKAVLDSLRPEFTRGRVVRRRDGTFWPGEMSRATEVRMAERAAAARARLNGQAEPLSWIRGLTDSQPMTDWGERGAGPV